MSRRSSKPTAKPKDTRRISQMRNLGPAVERDLNAVGIVTAQQVIDLGAEGAFLKMLEGKAQKGSAAKAVHAAWLYALYAAIHDLDWRDVPEKVKTEFKQLTAEIRESGHYR